ncbi:MAG: nucleotidyl transferase AbiEii/AbiGii toxin family protein [Bacteroidales bacterium]|jgi:predicted nucleotidyltransferase component of viral defense system|nr:nucleotidyl transferase AbiEii/AbiGii toxin family protein [Bacteroidales bacterium]
MHILDGYKKQLILLLDLLPDIAGEKNFAMHGGTAINLFHLDFPRISVDMDLTYIPFSDNRNIDLYNIRSSLESIKQRIRDRRSDIYFQDETRASEHLKLYCVIPPDIKVKIEVNQINRGLIAKPVEIGLCDQAKQFANCPAFNVTTVGTGQLWGGKINAALDRQHPRDLFDAKNLLNSRGLTDEIKKGFIFYMLCGKRPFHELLNPHPIDQRSIFHIQFHGMSNMPFTYDEFDTTRNLLVSTIHKSLTNRDKDFILAFAKGEPKWDMADYGMYPAIKWKLLNIRNLKQNNYPKFAEQVNNLEKALNVSRTVNKDSNFNVGM